MSWKNTQRHSPADALIVQHKSLSEFDAVHNSVNWQEMEKTLSKPCSSNYPPLGMFEILILQAWHDLSDGALEKRIAGDSMFGRFIDLNLSESMPDQ